MTRCPVCRGRADPECLCHGTGVVDDDEVDWQPADRRDVAWLCGVTVVGLLAWAGALYLVLR